jgi:hypothetical protein
MITEKQIKMIAKKFRNSNFETFYKWIWQYLTAIGIATVALVGMIIFYLESYNYKYAKNKC